MATMRLLRYTAIFLLTGLFSHTAFAQILQVTERWTVPVTVNGRTLPYPFAGGLNCPQVSAADLDQDGLQDLYVFDRVGNAQVALLAEENGAGGLSYRFAPEVLVNFPRMTDWVLLRDYDGDGVQDIFTYNELPISGVKVYKGYYSEENILAFTPYAFNTPYNIIFFPLNSGGSTQLYVSAIDYPAIDDVDCDGDLDILTFNLAGGYTELFQNRSVEMGYGRDSLIYRLVSNCWGGFYESGFSNEVDLAAAPGQCANNLQDGGPITFRHSGSSLLTLDMNADGLKELVLGDVSFSNLVLLYNGGNCQQAWMNAQNEYFPAGDRPVDLPLFPASFYVDVDGDNRRDLLASPNLRLNVEDYEALWYYRNTGADDQPVFDFQTTTLFIDNMLDFGSGARPVPFDYDNDGLLDLVVGNFSYFEPFGNKNTRLFLFRNTGTATEPAFTLVDDDYLDLNIYSSTTFYFAPAFGDLDGDGDLDALIGEQNGQLFYAENTAGPDRPATFANVIFPYAGINIGQASVPFIADLNRDGLADILVGERSGNIDYFQNVGSPGNPVFNADPTVAPNRQFLGQIDTRVPGFTTGYSSPWLVEQEDGYLLVTGTQNGRLEVYHQIDGNLDGAFPLLTDSLLTAPIGGQTHPTLADWNNDGRLDLLVGNFRGGLSLYHTNLPAPPPVSTDDPALAAGPTLFPNPAANTAFLRWPGVDHYQWTLFDGRGVALRHGQGSDTTPIALADLPGGMYFLRVRAGERVRVVRVVRN